MKTASEILSISDNSRKQSYNSLTNLSKQLQDGSTIKGVVTGLTDEGEVIFTTSYGKFSLPSLTEINKGDKIELQIFRNNNHLEAAITSVNGDKTMSLVPVNLTALSSSGNNAALPETAMSSTSISAVVISNPAPSNNAFSATVTYVNLSQLVNNAALRENLADISNNAQIKAQIVTVDGIKYLSPYQFKAIVANKDELNGSIQLKTPWGIISTTDSQLSEVRVGQEIQLVLTQINQKPLMQTSFESLVIELISRINENHDEVEQLTKLTSNLPNNNGAKTLPLNPEEERRAQHSNVRTLNTSEYKLLLGELSEKLNSLQQMLVNYHSVEQNLPWIPISINIYDGEKQQKNRIFIKKTTDPKNITFVIDLELSVWGELQLQGNVILTESKEVENFQLILRHVSLEEGMQRQIASLFSIYQEISHGGGSITFEQVKGFSNKA